MRFSIITPSLNQSEGLKRCVASVQDQAVEHEHLIQDAGSTDGTRAWLEQDRRVDARVEPDEGMYDAINRGFLRATGHILAWLNCDEQYLPGTLERVERFFESHPAIDMVFGDVVIVDEACRYLCHRRVERPLLYHTWVCHLSTLSCGMFFRRRVLAGDNALLDTSYRCGGDGEWMVRLLCSGVQTASLRHFTSVFTRQPGNLSRSGTAREEWRRLRETAPLWVRALTPLWVLHHRTRRLVGGSYRQPPFTFSVFTGESLKCRVERVVAEPTFRCPPERTPVAGRTGRQE